MPERKKGIEAGWTTTKTSDKQPDKVVNQLKPALWGSFADWNLVGEDKLGTACQSLIRLKQLLDGLKRWRIYPYYGERINSYLRIKCFFELFPCLSSFSVPSFLAKKF